MGLILSTPKENCVHTSHDREVSNKISLRQYDPSLSNIASKHRRIERVLILNLIIFIHCVDVARLATRSRLIKSIKNHCNNPDWLIRLVETAFWLCWCCCLDALAVWTETYELANGVALELRGSYSFIQPHWDHFTGSFCS